MPVHHKYFHQSKGLENALTNPFSLESTQHPEQQMEAVKAQAQVQFQAQVVQVPLLLLITINSHLLKYFHILAAQTIAVAVAVVQSHMEANWI